MARVNIEDELVTDPRFRKLVKLVGDEDKAVGMCVRFWRLAQSYWGKNEFIPMEQFELEDLNPIIEAGLGIVKTVKKKKRVYARGSEDRFAWYRQKCDAAKKGGRKPATVKGSNLNRNLAPVNRDSDSVNRDPDSVNPLTPTPVLTPVNKNTNTSASDSPSLGVFLELWNENRGALPRAQKLNDSRKRKIRVRLNEEPDMEYWRLNIQRMAASEFCCSGKWATFDWLIENDTNHVKVAEGNYDNRTATKKLQLTAPMWKGDPA